MKYYKYKVENLITVKNIVTIEYLELSSSYIFSTESHNFWELVYVDKNEITYYIDNTPFIIKEGEIVFLKPNQQHSIKANGINEPSIFVLCFDSQSNLMHFFNGYKSFLNKQCKQFVIEIINETKNTFKLPFKEKLQLLDNPNLAGQQAITIYLELLLIALLRLEQNKKNNTIEFIKDVSFVSTLSEKIIAYLKTKVYENITINDVCLKMNYSKSYICQSFKQINGISIINYFNNLKIDEAKKIIRTTKKTMSEISDILQFSEPRYFNFLFKKLTNKTPMQYRNSIMK